MAGMSTAPAGPVFLVGNHRSGTRLIRYLLNRHPAIALATSDSQFIPFMVARYGDRPDFGDAGLMDDLYGQLTRTNFAHWQREKGVGLIPRRDIDGLGGSATWADVFERILKYSAGWNGGRHVVWGDKTPNYMMHMDLLNGIFPGARFIHIIRDPRDTALSTRRAWSKSLVRKADQWRERIGTARRQASRFPERYREILYEDLIESPERTLESITSWLGCGFSPAMLTVDEPYEQVGDGRGERRIVSENRGKYLTRLSPDDIRRIEEITYPVLGTLPYDIHYATGFRLPGRTFLRLCMGADMLGYLAANVRGMGLVTGVAYTFEDFRMHLLPRVFPRAVHGWPGSDGGAPASSSEMKEVKRDR